MRQFFVVLVGMVLTTAPGIRAAEPKPRATLSTGGREVRIMKFSPDGKRLVVAAGRSYSPLRMIAFMVFDLLSKSFEQRRSGYYDQRITVLDVLTGKEIASIRVNEVDCLVLSPDGKMLAVGGNSTFRRRFVDVWDLSGIAPRQTARLRWDDFDNPLLSLAFSPDRKSLATAGKNVRLWDLRTETELRTIQKKEGVGASIGQVAFSPDGKLLAWATWTLDIPFFEKKRKTKVAGEVCLADVATGRKVITVDRGPFLIEGFAFSPNSKMLTIRTFGRGLQKESDSRMKETVWDITPPKGLVIRRQRTLKAFAIGALGGGETAQCDKLVAWNRSKGVVHLRESVTGKMLARFKAHSAGDVKVAFTPDGKILATGSNEIKLWNVAELIKLK
jgi:WD40 repeat protein